MLGTRGHRVHSRGTKGKTQGNSKQARKSLKVGSKTPQLHPSNGPVREVSQATWQERTNGLPHTVRNAVRQALAIISPRAAASLYESQHVCVVRADPRAKLRGQIARNLARFPDDWRVAAEPLLQVGEEGFGDGILIEAWAPSTIKRCLEAGAQHFDYCRAQGLAVDITPSSIRAKLGEAKASVESGNRRIGGVAIHVGALAGLAPAVQPKRSWNWLKITSHRMKKLAKHHGSRNASRAVDAAELRAAGQQLLEKADIAHAAARHRRQFLKAHTMARTALTMIMLAEAPIRITSCSEIELAGSLLADLDGLFLDAANTKEGDGDRRAFSRTLIDAIGRYVRLHRVAMAAPGETRLFVSDRGGPINASQLSKCLGDFTEPVFGVRLTPHAIRHSVGNFIAATVPHEAALASLILNHRSDAVTPTYTRKADQIVASRRLGAATEQAAEALSADTSPTRGVDRKPRSRRPVRPPRKPSKRRPLAELED